MFVSSLSTKNLLETLKSSLDDFRSDDALTHSQWTKLISPRNLIRALNEADVQLCGDLKVTTQVVIFLPEKTSFVYLRSNEYQVGDHSSAFADILDKEPDGNHYKLYNTTWYRNIGTLRSQYVVAYKSFPLGDGASPTARYATVPFTTFQQSNAGQPYCDDKFGVLPVAHVDHNRGIIQFSRAQDADSFLSFKAHVVPEKIDYAEIENNIESVVTSYTPVCPTYGEKALRYAALCELLPITNPVYDKMETLYDREFKKLRLRVPHDRSVIQVESWL